MYNVHRSRSGWRLPRSGFGHEKKKNISGINRQERFHSTCAPLFLSYHLIPFSTMIRIRKMAPDLGVYTECAKIYRKSVLNLLCSILKQMQYRFAVTFLGHSVV